MFGSRRVFGRLPRKISHEAWLVAHSWMPIETPDSIIQGWQCKSRHWKWCEDFWVWNSSVGNTERVYASKKRYTLVTCLFTLMLNKQIEVKTSMHNTVNLARPSKQAVSSHRLPWSMPKLPAIWKAGAILILRFLRQYMLFMSHTGKSSKSRVLDSFN